MEVENMNDEERRKRATLAKLMGWEPDQVNEMLGDEGVEEMLRRRLPPGEERDAAFAAFFHWLRRETPSFLAAIKDNTAATAGVLGRIETTLDHDRPAFQAPSAVLEEGEFLKAQLAIGRLGTTAAESGFENARPPQITSGLELLAATLTPPPGYTP
jgi:hypothetical protein